MARIKNDSVLDKKTKDIYLSGIVNSLWQAWNSYWRTFWLANLLGGFDVRENLIIPTHVTVIKSKGSEPEALFYLLYILGKRHTPAGSITGSYQEATWGDRERIEKITLRLRGSQDGILNAMPDYGDAIDHLQTTRNTIIHPGRYNYNKIRTEVMPFYIETKMDFPTDLLFFTRLSSGRQAYKEWMDSLRAFLTFT